MIMITGKKEYKKLELVIIEFDNEDVITESKLDNLDEYEGDVAENQ